jgi:hypothetical protein
MHELIQQTSPGQLSLTALGYLIEQTRNATLLRHCRQWNLQRAQALNWNVICGGPANPREYLRSSEGQKSR